MVGETLRMPISVSGGGNLIFGFEGPEDVPAFNRTASISGSASAGGEFRWTPLASHVGAHEVIIQLLDGGDVVDSTPVVINVTSSTDAAPTFIRPGPGNAYDLAQDPCVRFDIEVRDDDTSNVDIEARTALPEGAEVTQTDAKRAEFEWCPSDSQAGTAERWTIPLVANDGTHETPLDYIVVLRGEVRDDCPGDAPNVTVVSPADGGRITSSSGWEVRANVTDDMDLRDAPLLFYTTSRPDDLVRPDITEFEQLVMRPRSGEWSARVPSVQGDEGDSQTFYFVVSATDNDDPTGSACDHRTDSQVIEFEAVIGSGGGDLGECESCSTNADCSEGRCAQTADGGLCVADCSENECVNGSCGATPTTDGAVLAGCGPVEDICVGVGGYMCMGDDGREDDDTSAQATLYSGLITDGEACVNDPDFFRIPVDTNDRITVRLFGFNHDDGDLDLELLDSSGTALASSASTENEELIEYCFGASTTAFARVFGYDGDANEYSLEVNSASGSACCIPDAFEDNNTREDASTLALSSSVAGSVCPGDIDYFSFSVTSPAQLDITLNIVTAGEDLDVRLLSPGGTTIATSIARGSMETISQRVTEAGTYMVAIDGFQMDTSNYMLTVDEAMTSGCATSLECPLDQVCSDDGTCTSRVCQFTFSCPANYGCPTPGPGTESECGSPCARNGDCRALEACKWFPQGRFCAKRGGGSDGDTCSDFSDCGGQSSCLDWPGGLCARAGCTSNSDCATGSFCFEDNTGENVCAPNCTESDTQCRPSGYDCSLEPTLGGSLEFLCIPE
ncbi:MAG: hypothetical protein ACI9KE_004239 [Polyangiales bacterium]|jgi:hypothetical protein